MLQNQKQISNIVTGKNIYFFNACSTWRFLYIPWIFTTKVQPWFNKLSWKFSDPSTPTPPFSYSHSTWDSYHNACRYIIVMMGRNIYTSEIHVVTKQTPTTEPCDQHVCISPPGSYYSLAGSPFHQTQIAYLGISLVSILQVTIPFCNAWMIAVVNKTQFNERRV